MRDGGVGVQRFWVDGGVGQGVLGGALKVVEGGGEIWEVLENGGGD